MRETRLSGSEGGGTQWFSLPLSWSVKPPLRTAVAAATRAKVPPQAGETSSGWARRYG